MQPAMREMSKAARDYCEVIEGSGLNGKDWLKRVARLLPRVHAAVAELAEDMNGSGQCLDGDMEARFELFSHLRTLLGERDGYWTEYDFSRDTEAQSGSLADDLTDIYCELKHGLRLSEQGMEVARDSWCEGYKVHWGQHLVDAERHLYDLRVRGLLD